jgi:7-cyano-7-deazaguanine reductase
VRIVARWNVRGGITTNVVAEYRKSGWTAADPVVLPLDSERSVRP